MNRHRILAAWSSLLALVVVALPPFAQPAAYHAFSDQRTLVGVPHFGDVVSNLAFFAVGVVGVWSLLFGPTRTVFRRSNDRIPYLVFFAGVASIGVGSAYYHWCPDNTTLFWDRATMSLAFMALFAAVIADRVDQRLGLRVLPLLLLVGLGSVAAWRVVGDIRFYVVLCQLWPISSILLVVLLLYPRGHYVSTPHVLLLACLYGGAVAFERSDVAVWRLSEGFVSGHTLKHLAAAAAVSVVLPMLNRFRSVTREPKALAS